MSTGILDYSDIMKKLKQLTMPEVVATGDQYPAPPYAYRKIYLQYRVAGESITEKALSQAIELSQKKCSMAAAVRSGGEISTDYDILSIDESWPG